MDTVAPEVRSRIMAAIPSKDTKPEMAIRRALHALGLRYRLHVQALPGCPDIVLPRHRTVILVHGCFWHDHGCLKRLPDSEEWVVKLARNRQRDVRNKQRLIEDGWRVMTVWECGLRSAGPEVAAELIYWWVVERGSSSLELAA